MHLHALYLKCKKLEIKNINKVIIGNLKKNSVPNKFDPLKKLVLKYV